LAPVNPAPDNFLAGFIDASAATVHYLIMDKTNAGDLPSGIFILIISLMQTKYFVKNWQSDITKEALN